jgi:hypothetical protein
MNNEAENIIKQINKCKTRQEAAEIYADMLCVMEGGSFGSVNEAIIEKWSMSGLKYIKKMAWDRWGVDS